MQQLDNGAMAFSKDRTLFNIGDTFAFNCNDDAAEPGLYVYHVLSRTKHTAMMAIPFDIVKDSQAAMEKVRDLKANPGNPMYGTIKKMRVRLDHMGAEYISVGKGSHAMLYSATHGRVNGQPSVITLGRELNLTDIDALERYHKKTTTLKRSPPPPSSPIRKRDEVILLERTGMGGDRAIVIGIYEDELGIYEDELILKMKATGDVKIFRRRFCMRAP